jgi:polyhydroxybutyrate depolymerase
VRPPSLVLPLALAALIVAAGCGAGRTESPGSTATAAQPDLSGIQGDRTISVQADIGLRPVLVHHPDLVGARAPLVVVLHGEGGSAEQARDELGWNTVADREGFVVAYPQGVNHAWNAGPACCFPNNAGVNDIGFLNEVLSALTKQDLIDRARVYAVGFSAGGSMAYTWECAHPGVLAGVGPVDAPLLIQCPVLAPVSVAAVYGGDDRALAPEDGTGPTNAGTSAGTGPSVSTPPGRGDLGSNAHTSSRGGPPASGVLAAPGQQLAPPAGEGQPIALFRRVDMCPAQPASVTGGPPATERSWNCVATHSVSTAVVTGVGHQWPGASPGAIPSASTVAPDSTPPGATSGSSSSTGFDTDEWLWSHLRNARSR